MSKEESKRKAAKLADTYFNVITSEAVEQKMNLITMVHNVNFSGKPLSRLKLLNALVEYRLDSIFCNISSSLRMFHTAPVIMASAE